MFVRRRRWNSLKLLLWFLFQHPRLITPVIESRHFKQSKIASNQMRSRSVGAIASVLLTALFCSAQKQTESSQTQKFSSPDGKIVALVRSTKAPEATNESRVELRSQNGRVFAKRNYGSEDGEHGYGVTKAAWTPDSQFFVYSLESSGGHQSWHTPVQFFWRSENKIISLDDALKDAVTNPQFLLSAPDCLTVEVMLSKQTKTVSLHDLSRK